MRFRTAWFVSLTCLLCAGQVLAYNFNFTCGPDNFVSKAAGVDHVFYVPISAVPPGNDPVQVTFEPHIPDTWFSQWCQTSTGICYFGNATITLPAGEAEHIDLDVFVNGDTTPQKGWIDMTFRSVADPLEVQHCTYTLFSGLPLPTPPIVRVNCNDNTRQLANGATYAEFFTPFTNLTSQPDTLLVTMTTSMPGDWFGQFCQQSTGICYFDYGTMPIAAGATDTIHVQAFLGASPSAGAMDFVIQSKRNPSIGSDCHYRVYVGQGSTGAPHVATALPPVQIVPNPSSAETNILLRGMQPGVGSLGIYAADGRLVREFPALQLGGNLQVRWDGRDQSTEVVPGGVYFYRLITEGQHSSGVIIRQH